jgi:CubicO group peptidase (beta-lactamase class C family)
MDRYRNPVTVFVVLLAFFLLLTPVSGQTSEPYWPTDGWRTSTPEEQGMDSAVLLDLLNELHSGVTISAHSLLVIRHGYVVLDVSSAPYRSDQPHQLYSAAKSFLSTLAGIAIDKGLIGGVDQSIWDFFSKEGVANMDARKEAIQLQHLLTMSSGLNYAGMGQWYEDPMYLIRENGPAWVNWMLGQRMMDEPGTAFLYSDGQAQLVSAIIQKASGQTALAFAQENLFAPLGIRDVTWLADPQGVTRGGGDLFISPRDMAKLGYLFLRNGEWDGQQIVSPAWVASAVTDFYAGPPDYGYYWWLNTGALPGYGAQGYGGQAIFVLPEQDMVVVVTGDYRAYGESVRVQAASAATADAPLPPNPAAQEQLQALVEAMQNPAPVEVVSKPELEAQISGQMYDLSPNTEKWTGIGLTFEGDQAVLHLEMVDNPLDIPVGLDGVYRVSEHGLPALTGWLRTLPDVPLAAQGRWGRGESFIVHLRDLRGMQEMELILNFKDGLEVSLSENYALAKLGRYGFTVRGTLR